jgi:uncharacterized protein (DUF488 family)
MSRIFTVGYSRHPVSLVLGLLKQHGVCAVVDVRSRPWSARSPEFNEINIAKVLAREAISYTMLGQLLGGAPEGDRFYRPDGRVRYDVLARDESFIRGIDLAVEVSRIRPTVLMCCEADPLECHRHHLLAPALHRRGVSVSHILADGSLLDANPEDFLFPRELSVKPARKSLRVSPPGFTY